MTPPATTADAGPAIPGSADGDQVRSWSWHIMAVSSWLLLVLLPIHVLSTWVFHDPAHFGVALYIDRWHHGYWRLLDGALVVLALVHGGIGLSSRLVEGRSDPRVKAGMITFVAVVLGVVGLLAVSTIFTFELS